MPRTPTKAYPSMSAAMMLEHIGEPDAAGRLMAAIERVTSKGKVLTADLGGSATTAEVTEAVSDALSTGNV